MNGRSIAAAAAMLVTGFFMPAKADAVEIDVLGSPAFRESYLELVPQFEKASGHKVVTRWAGTADIMRSMQAGESADLVILSRSRLDELAAQGRIVPASRTDLAKSGVGVAVRAGAPRPDISSGEALKRALLAAKSVGYSSGPSGDYVVALFQRLGIAEQIRGKLKKTPPGVAVGGLIANGEAEIGFQQVSELLAVKGIDLVGPLSPDVQQITVFSAGIHAAAKQPDAAKELVKFLTSPQSVPVKKKHGMEPG
jgi:molybdate transport system substrate-binding protein